MKMTEAEAREILGVQHTPLDKSLVDAAFNGAVKRNHPDTTAQAAENLVADMAAGVDITASRSTWTVDKLKEARDLLRQVVAGADNRCVTCRGTGIVRAKMGATLCAACRGTGDKRQ